MPRIGSPASRRDHASSVRFALTRPYQGGSAEEGSLVDEAQLQPILEERTIVEGLLRGDRNAAGTLYAWYGDALFREVILPRLPIRELAENVLVDTFRTVMERVETYKPESDKSIYFWLRRIAINRSIDVHRAHQRVRRLEDALEAETDPMDASPAPDKDADVEDTRARVEAALQKVNPRYAEALRLRLLEDLDREECAAKMGVTVGNFDVILHRASAAFRKAFQPDVD